MLVNAAAPAIDCPGAERLIKALLQDAHGERVRWRFRGIVVSVLVHSAAFGLLGIDFASLRQDRTPPESPRRVQMIYVPARVDKVVERPAEPEASAQRAVVAPRQIEQVAFPPIKRQVNMNSIEISVAKDTANQLPAVIRQQGGLLALVDKDDQSIARYVFEPPDWTLREAVTDISDKVRFSMAPPEEWAVVRDLQRRYSIEFDRYVVSALFNGGYTACLQEAIRRHADEMHAEGDVKSARLLFTTSRPCGIEVLHVSSTDSHEPTAH